MSVQVLLNYYKYSSSVLNKIRIWVLVYHIHCSVII